MASHRSGAGPPASAALEFLDALPEASFLVDATGTLLHVNDKAEAMFGYSREELRGRPIETLVPQRLREGHAIQVARYLEQPKSRPMGAGLTLQLLQKSGIETPVDISLTPLITDRGAFVLGTVRDIARREEHYRNIVEQLAVGIVHSTLGGELLSVNKRFVEMSGYSREEVMQLNVHTLSHPQEAKRSMAARRRMLRKGGGYFERDARVLRKDGSPLWTRMTTSLLRDAHGLAQHFVTVVIDISRQKDAEAAHRESELRFRQVTENIREVFWLTDLEKSEALYVSKAYEDIWGRRLEALATSANDWIDAIHPEDKPRVLRAALERQAQGGYEEEYRITRPDGTTRWIRDRAFPVADERGNTVRIAGIAEDITDKKQAEDALRESERRFAAMLQNVQLISLMLDRRGRITYCNDYLLRLTGWTREEMTGRSWSDFLLPEALGELAAVFASLIEDRPTAWHNENEICTRSGERRMIRWNNTVLRSAAGDVIGTASIGEDVTDRRRAEQDVRRHLARIEQAMYSTVNVIAAIGELRDPYTHGHERRVAELAAAIGAELGIEGERIEGLRIAGRLHDVGKLGVPAEILAKPAPLNAAEIALVREHPQRGYEILKAVDFSWPVAEIAWQHHERLDGSGYPRGLRGEEILIEARILAIADTVDAMASHRPYRPGLGLEAALAEIESNRGALYDTAAADACLRLFRQRGFTLS